MNFLTLALLSQIPGPVVIDHGGVYGGLHAVGTNQQPAIFISTTQPVTIENSTISFMAKPGIFQSGPGANLTVEHCQFQAVNPNRSGVFQADAINLGGGTTGAAAYYKIQNNTIVGSGGSCIYLNGLPPHSTVLVNFNWIQNLQGSPSDGNGGWLPALWRDGHTHAVQASYAQSLNGRFNWNLVQNAPFVSSSDDQFNFYNTNGTATNPIQCNFNYVDGVYSGELATQENRGAAFTTDGQPGPNETAFVQFYGDYAVNLGASGFRLPVVGHDITFDFCCVYATGYSPDSTHTPLFGINVGIAAYTGNNLADPNFYNNLVKNCSSYVDRPPFTDLNGTNQDNTYGSCWFPGSPGVEIQNFNYWDINSTSAARLFAQWKAEATVKDVVVGD